MLNHLSIQSLPLVDHLDLEFHPGMSVITGETGAGKSILLGALGLALGDRADSSFIAAGAAKAEISASFDLANNKDALAWLHNKDLGDGDQCILRRVISKDGRSRAFINGSSITLGELKNLSEMLLDIHSQHEHQSLLKKETHRRLLDEFGGLGDVVAQVGDLFDELDLLSKALNQLKADTQEQSARMQLLSYQAEELTTLAIQPGETEALEDEQKRLSSADIVRGKLDEVALLCNQENEASASSFASRALKLLEGITDEAITPIRELLSTAVIQIDEAMSDLGMTIDKFDSDPSRLQEVEQRLGSIYDTARKHRVQPGELVQLTMHIQAELDDMVHADTKISELDEQVRKVEANYKKQAMKLNQSRCKTAELLETDVIAQLAGLGMEGAVFVASIAETQTPGRSGMDNIEFLISTIPGKEPDSLARIASGGELSRISLAIQVITAKTSNTPTLVFDEVDVGVSGATAEVVGALLRQLGRDAQIICVTHLPQVAAQGHHHYVVTKSTTTKSARANVTRLSEEEKIDEIARMLGGIEKTDQSVAHAQAMIRGVGQR
jgi:DNA repair protein RecN (Recombination protein N)